jgi:hypothetical protein
VRSQRPPPTPPKRGKQFPPSVKKGGQFDVPDGIIAHLTRECGGNVHEHQVVDVTSASFEKETQSATTTAENAADLRDTSYFYSSFRNKEEHIPHTRNNWLCYDFKERRIVPTHYTIRTNDDSPGGCHLKSWLVETSVDGESWRKVAREEDNKQLNSAYLTGTFAVAGGRECRFIRLVNVGRNHCGDDRILISAWEVFGNLIE